MWTKAQEQAINARSGNVIVSAGAGSGKTAVLTERVYQLLKNHEAKVDEMLVLTFTNAAAHEMKTRIRNQLRKNGFFALADEVEASNITTFDAYALSLVKRFHLYLGISKKVRILDSSILEVEKNKIINAVFLKYYNREDEDFTQMIMTYCPKNDASLKFYITDILRLANLKIDKDRFLADYFKTYLSEEMLEKMINEVIDIAKTRVEDCLLHLDGFEDLDFAHKLEEALVSISNIMSYDDLYYAIERFRFPRAAKLSEDDKIIKDAVKKYLDLVFDKIVSLGIKADISASFLNPTMRKSLKILLDIALEVDAELTKFKKFHNAYDFADIAKMALNLLNDDDVKNEIRKSIKFIMIDEYQDTSDIQDALINAIGDENIFMVGDTKQSIYRFRNANCEIFQGKYDEFKKNRGGSKIDLNANFRSRKEVIEGLNNLFSVLMSKRTGGVDYRLEHIIEHGNKKFDELGATGQNHDIEAITYSSAAIDISAAEHETRLIANDIIDKINNKYLVFDNKLSTTRPVTFSDFAVLIDRKTMFENFQMIFDEYGLPLRIYKEELIASTQVGAVLNSFVNILLCVMEERYDSEFRHAFVSIARSFICQYSDQDIYDILSQNTIFETSLMEKIKNIATSASELSLSEILMLTIRELDVYHKLILLGDIEANQQNIDSIILTARMMEDIGYTFKDFYEYLKNLKNLKIELSFENMIEAGNVIKIMSIHKSKGLEFGIIYYPMLDKSFNRLGGGNTSFLTSNQYGLIMPVIEKDSNDNLNIQSFLSKERERQENLSERIRLFYVALTRAKEKIILVRDLDNQKTILSIDMASSFADFMEYAMNHKVKINGCQVSLHDVKVQSSFVEEEPIKINVRETMPLTHKKATKNAASSKAVRVPKEVLNLGNRLHYFLEIVDFTTKDTSFIENKSQRELIDAILHLDVFKEAKTGQIFKEYEFIDEINEIRGVIDLMIVYSGHIDIFDYKTRQIDDISYHRQLAIYQQYVERIYQKTAKLHLISIMEGRVERI